MKLLQGLAVVAMFGCLPSPVQAQTVNQSNYRQTAVCVERVVNGRTFNTFGEGPCPAGSRSPTQYNTLDPNERKLAQTQAAVDAIGGMQQSLVSWGHARVQAKRKETARILGAYTMDIPAVDVGSGISKYTSVIRRIPDAGVQAFAEVGQTLIFTQTGFYSDCFASTEAREKTYMGWVHVMKAGEPACKISLKDKGFTPSYTNYSHDKDRASDPFVYEQFVKFDKQSYSICIKDMGIKFGCIKEMPEGSVRTYTGFVGAKGTETRLVSYEGFKDGMLRFGYNPSNAPSGSPVKEIIVNPAEGRNVTIDDINFEIVEWSDTTIVVKMQ
jgi:hypothetical protein